MPLSRVLFDFQQATAGDVDEISLLETASYPEDEAASREGIAFRIEKASDWFHVARSKEYGKDNEEGNGLLLGFVNGTLSTQQHLTHESMSNHEPEGNVLCIHSVVVAPNFRRLQLGTDLLRRYCQVVKEKSKSKNGIVTEMRLLCKEVLIPFYSKAGFEVVGISEVVHGKDTWIEMKQLCH